MVYRSYKDLAGCLRRNAWKVPSDVGLIVGVPRSGMIAALMLAELLNRPCATLDDFASGRVMACGGRGRLARVGDRVLVLDDTVSGGGAMRAARERLEPLSGSGKVIYGCVYAEGRDAKGMVDVWLEDLWREGEDLWLYEWNILHHYGRRTRLWMWDIDGLLCKEPPDERDTAAYEGYLAEALPMAVPTTPVGAIVTYRLEKYRSATEEWLLRHGVRYGSLVMFPASSHGERRRMQPPADFKAAAYLGAPWARLFLESDARQALRINGLTGKPVFCYEDGRMYM